MQGLQSGQKNRRIQGRLAALRQQTKTENVRPEPGSTQTSGAGREYVSGAVHRRQSLSADGQVNACSIMRTNPATGSHSDRRWNNSKKRCGSKARSGSAAIPMLKRSGNGSAPSAAQGLSTADRPGRAAAIVALAGPGRRNPSLAFRRGCRKLLLIQRGADQPVHAAQGGQTWPRAERAGAIQYPAATAQRPAGWCQQQSKKAADVQQMVRNARLNQAARGDPSMAGRVRDRPMTAGRTLLSGGQSDRRGVRRGGEPASSAVGGNMADRHKKKRCGDGRPARSRPCRPAGLPDGSLGVARQRRSDQPHAILDGPEAAPTLHDAPGGSLTVMREQQPYVCTSAILRSARAIWAMLPR